ncbi:MAG: PhoX family protein, partial [Chloroflexi bacterium]|nr:PhoX family protein [Chloroflexota bacterium]
LILLFAALVSDYGGTGHSASARPGAGDLGGSELAGPTPLTDDGPYVKPAMPGVTVEPILTVAEAVPQTSEPGQTYRLVGKTDGLGAYAAGGQVGLFLNHEIAGDDATEPLVNRPFVNGAFISHYLLTPGSPAVLSGDLAFGAVLTRVGNGWRDDTAEWLAGDKRFERFCSGYLAGPAEGFGEWIYLTGEEIGFGGFNDLGGAAVAVAGGVAYVLPEMGHFSKENVVILPGTGSKTVAFALEDGPSDLNNQLFMYVGTKNPTGATPVERAGLVGGSLYFFRSTVTGWTNEYDYHKGDSLLGGEWVAVDSVLLPGETVATMDAQTLNGRVAAAGAFAFIRIEDGEADVSSPGDFYFVTTGSGYTLGSQIVNRLGRLYQLVVDVDDPAGGAPTLDILLEGDAGDPIVNPDNVAINGRGQMLIQEDVGSSQQGAYLEALGRDTSIWLYDLPGDDWGGSGWLMRVAEIDQTAVPPGYRGIAGAWESSGVIDVAEIYGPGTWLLDVQAFTITSLGASQLQGSPADLHVSGGGQLLLLDTGQVGKGPYLKPISASATVMPLLTVGDVRPRTGNAGQGFRLVGLPDGLGVYQDGGQVRLLANHELGANTVSAPLVNSSFLVGAFVSEYLLEPGVVASSGDLAFDQVFVVTSGSIQDVSAEWLAGLKRFDRLCSGYMAGPADGLEEWVYLTGEESESDDSFNGLGGEAVAVAGGVAYLLPEIGHFAKENVVVLPGTGNRTVVLALEDAPVGLNSQLFMYVGSKNPAGATPVERAGLVGGTLYFFRSTTAGETDEDSFHKGDGPVSGEWVAVDSVLLPGETVATVNVFTLNMRVSDGGAFAFVRIEDGEADRNLPGVFYFATTGSADSNGAGDSINNLGRLYRLAVNADDPAASPATLEILLEGDAGDPIVNPDNVAVNDQGQMLIQENPNIDHQGAYLEALGRDSSVWLYDLPGDGLGEDDTLLRIAEIDQSAVPAELRGNLGSWESSGVIDASAVWGPGRWLLTVQAHSIDSVEASQLQGSAQNLLLAQGGQLLLLNTSNLRPGRFFLPWLGRE